MIETGWRLDQIEPLKGTRDYIEEVWMTPGDKALAHSEDENAPAFSGVKYDCYGGYGSFMQPTSIMEIGVAAGYSIAAMIHGAGGSVKEVVLVDMHLDITNKTLPKLREEFPTIKFHNYHLNTQTQPLVIRHAGFDIIHIDGDHTFEGAMKDLVNFGHWIAYGGLIVVDDCKDPNVYHACEIYWQSRNLEHRWMENHNGHVLMKRRDV